MKIGDYASSSMQQSCQIVVSGNAVSIISSVPEGSTWTPDNFELTLEGDQMTGRLVSGSAASALLLRKTDGFTPPPPPEGFAGRETLAGQPQGWREVGTDTKGCKFEYLSPLRVFGDPPSIRVTIRSDCGGTTDEGVPFDRSELNLWYVCNGDVQYAEAEVLFSGEEVVDRWTSTAYGMAADGPTLHEAGIPGSTLQSTAVMRQLYDRFCA